MRSRTYFSRAFFRSVRSPCSMNTRTEAPVRLRQRAGVAGEGLVARDAAELPAEVDAGCDELSFGVGHAFAHADGDEADVVGVGDATDAAAAVVRDVVLAREAVQLAVV